ncbi:hypothetical protein XA68_14458 [Ophiocordyceps unilateralis]|uniref:Uncharacterized protein n=1 Tax=Ophiocordyceps unilateralis TaxID=268505 RepID=A0A2A9P9H6_OPHUN|nr:hypothetical protein XA68_14458 [Ophiocordyceps unilateralis]
MAYYEALRNVSAFSNAASADGAKNFNELRQSGQWQSAVRRWGREHLNLILGPSDNPSLPEQLEPHIMQQYELDSRAYFRAALASFKRAARMEQTSNSGGSSKERTIIDLTIMFRLEAFG